MLPLVQSPMQHFPPGRIRIAEWRSRWSLRQQYISCVIPYSAEEASKCSRRFCLLYKALETEASLAGKINLWNMKPKVHLLQELVEYQSFQHGAPRHFWCYRDESWCGWWAKASLRRGGANNAATAATRFLQRFRILDPELVWPLLRKHWCCCLLCVVLTGARLFIKEQGSYKVKTIWAKSTIFFEFAHLQVYLFMSA